MARRGKTFNGITYSSFKHPMLEWIFNKYNPTHDTSLKVIQFTLQDISDGYSALGIREPASISNTILDLTRKKRPISSRLPESIYSLGYDLKKKTGGTGKFLPDGKEDNFAGEFVFVGVGNELSEWLEWPDVFDAEFTLSSNPVPQQILPYLRQDEGALFSIIDYCDMLSTVFENSPNSVVRIQNPLKWQPNEIDGFYHGTWPDGDVLYPVEAKALTTGDDINLVQMLGGLRTLSDKLSAHNVYIQPVAARMVKNGVHLAVFQRIKAGDDVEEMHVTKRIKVIFDPVFAPWE